MGLGHILESFVLMIAQIVKKILIIATIAAIIFAIYFVWKNFIKETQYKTHKAAVDQAQKQGIEAK